MAIRKISIEGKRNGYPRDPKTGKYFSYEIDFYVKTNERDSETGQRIKKRHREKGFLTRAAEEAIANIRLREKEGKFGIPGAVKQITVKELFDARLPTIQSKQERVRAERVLNYFLALLEPAFLVTELTTPVLRRYLDARGKDSVKPQTISREMTTIAATLHKAGELFTSLDSWKCPRIPRPRMSKMRRERFVTDEERAKILADLYNANNARPRMPQRARQLAGLIFEFAHLSGARHGEICALRKTYYNRTGRSLKIVRRKTDSISYLEPLTNRMIEILDEAINLNPESEFIFTRSGQVVPRYYSIMREACERAGVPYGRDTADGIITHDARHTFTTRLQQDGIDLATIQSFTGHSDREIVMRYSHARPESRARAMRAIEGVKRFELDRDFLAEIYAAVVSGKMNFDEFSESLAEKIASTL